MARMFDSTIFETTSPVILEQMRQQELRNSQERRRRGNFSLRDFNFSGLI
jgi:hypothetical protein